MKVVTTRNLRHGFWFYPILSAGKRPLYQHETFYGCKRGVRVMFATETWVQDRWEEATGTQDVLLSIANWAMTDVMVVRSLP